MRENGITWVKSISKVILLFLDLNYILFFIRFLPQRIKNRSPQSLNRYHSKRIDTNERMENTKRGQENMIEFVKILPDECIIELSERWFCGKR